MSYEFLCNYQDIHATFEDPGKAPNKSGTWAKLVEHYKAAPEFIKLAKKTKAEYARYMSIIENTYGDVPVALLTTPEVYELRDVFQETPRKADFLVSVVSRLLTFSIQRGYRKDNPAIGVKKIHSTDGYRAWEDYEIKAFRDVWKAGTLERVAFELALNTGQRGGDIIKMTRDRYRNGWVKVKQEKTGDLVDVPATRALKAVLDPWLAKQSHMMLITSGKGAAFEKRHFEKIMRSAYNEVGFGLDITTHGLRYTAATVLHELQLDWEVIASITGHKTMQMVQKYTRKKRLAARAIAKLDENEK